MPDTNHILQETVALLQQALMEEDPLLQVLCRYKAHAAFAPLEGTEVPAAAEVYWPILRVLEKSGRTYTKEQLRLVVSTLRLAQQQPQAERHAMRLVDDMEHAGLPVNPPFSGLLTELISNLELDPED